MVPLAVRAAKQAAITGLSMPLAEGQRLEDHLVRMLFATGDFTEGASAFAEKRTPKWKAR